MEGGAGSGRRASGILDGLLLLQVGAVYWLDLQLQVRGEIATWESRARRIPDSLLRERATEKLTGERLNPEAAALFAVLAPRSQQREVVRLIVAYQVLYDYLDGVNETPGFDEIRQGLQLHRALTEAVIPAHPLSDYYLHHQQHDDGGYMLALTETCRSIVAGIPSIHASAPVLAAATRRCAEAQAHNHAPGSDRAQLAAWSAAQEPGATGYLWWEVAAGGISCLAIHALLASAADPRTDLRESERVDAAYFPSICALSALLDSLADFDFDEGTGNHSFVAHYRDPAHAAGRLLDIMNEATALLEPLRNRRRHAVILAGIVAYYLSAQRAWSGFPSGAASALTSCSGLTGRLLRTTLAARRRLHARRYPGLGLPPG